MIKRDDLINFINRTLNFEEGKDPYGPNGLQVIGKREINKIALGVSANLELFNKAVAWGADLIIVHHGLFWNSDERVIKKIMKQRLKTLFDNDITLLGYHLFLDNHPSLGNNSQIIKLLEAKKGKEFGIEKNIYWGYEASFNPKIDFSLLINRLTKINKIRPKVFSYGPKIIEKIAVVSGGGPFLVNEAIDKEIDAFITGEPREPTESISKEAKINFIYLGHYNSERFGIIALGNFLKKKYPELEIKFIDIPNSL